MLFHRPRSTKPGGVLPRRAEATSRCPFLLRGGAVFAWMLPVACGLCVEAHGAAGNVDLSFDAGSGLDGAVGALAIQADGRILIAGSFTQVRGLARPGLARLNPDGSGDASFDPATGGFGVVLQPDGKVLVGSARLNADGSLDPSFTLPVITDDFSITQAGMALQPDGRILIHGAFRSVGGVLRSSIARLNPDGSLDDTFIPDTSDNLYAGVYAIALQRDGKIIIAGQSMTVDNASIARLYPDGSRDVTFNAGPDDPVWALGLQPDGKVLIGGTFDNVNGAARKGIARLKADGALDEGFAPDAGASGWAQNFAVQTDGRIIVDRYLSTGPKLIRLHADGSVDGSFGPFDGNGTAYTPLAVQPDGMILAGGVGDGQPLTSALMRIETGGTRDEAFVVGGGVGLIYSVTPQPDGKVLLGGAIGPRANGSIARLNQNGSWDDTFHPAPGIPVDGERILLQADGRILLSGRSQSVDGDGIVTGRGEITRLHSDGSLDGSFQPDGGVPGGFHLMALQPDGRLLVCGENPSGEMRYKTVARLNTDGSADDSFEPLAMEAGHLPDINCVAPQADGRVLVGGRFSLDDDPVGYSLVRLNADGTLDASFHPTHDTDSTGLEVRTINISADGKILIAGIVSGADGVVGETVSRLNADGTVDDSFDTGSGISIFTATSDGGGIAWQPDGKVLASGYYRPETEEYYSGPVRLNVDGSLDRSFRFETGYFPGNRCLALQSDGNIIVGGGFLTIRGVLRPNVARLSGDPRPPVAFAYWAADFGLAGGNAAASADPDQDGTPNAAEYILGGNPSRSDAARPTIPTVRHVGGNLILTFRRDDASEARSTLLTVGVSTDLVDWSTVFTIGPDTVTSSPGVTVLENATALDHVTVVIPQDSDLPKFARLNVMITP